jgi:transcription elongation factor Elf1
MSTPAGWYPQPDGQQRYWDGEDWSEDSTPDAATPVTGPATGGEADKSPKKRPKSKLDDFRQWLEGAQAPEKEKPRLDRMLDSMKRSYKASLEANRGPINPKIECPQCHNVGAVAVRSAKQKVGVSGGKATGAVLTGGVSLIATGLSRKQRVSQAHCGNCGSDWTF